MSGPGSNVVVIGNGMVGQYFVDELLARSADAAEPLRITVLGAESLPAYDRVALSSYFDGATLDDLTLCDVDAMAGAGVDLRLGTTVASIDAATKTVVLEDGETVAYDQLVLATDSDPFVPPIPGADHPGCFVYRTIEDLDAIRAWAERAGVDRGVVIGGGLLGLEAANAVHNLGLSTAVVEMADRLMPQQLDEPAAAMLGRWVDGLGITTHLSFATKTIEGTDEAVTGLRTADGDVLPAELVVFSAGIRPRRQLAQAAGLAIGERGGVVIDDHCTTSDPSISAIGEVACHAGRVYGLVAPGYAMARVLADRLCGGSSTFVGADTSTKLKLLGVDVASFGTSAPSDDRVEFSDPETKVHRRISTVNGVVTGGVLVGDVSNYDVLLAMSTGAMASANVASLVLPEGLAPAAPSGDLPDSVQLCSCNNVLRGECKQAVADGCHDLGSLKATTNAGTGCGGCVPDLSKLLFVQLDALGIEAKKSLCSHFSQTRQELFDLTPKRR